MLQEVIVVAKHGDQYIDACLESLGHKYPVAVIDTSEGGHPSWAYIRAYREIKARNYLFIQDSMSAIDEDVVKPFRDRMPELGAVSWGRFHFSFDNSPQEEWAREHYSGPTPEFGIFGPVFYTSRKSLKILDEYGLLPPKPKDKLEAQGTERMWSWAFHNAGLPVVSIDYWDKLRMETGQYPIFQKTFGGRA